MAEGHRVSRHISRMCGRVGAGEPTFESYSVGKHSAAAPAVVSAHSQLSATRLATLLHAARRWVPLPLAHVGVCCRLVASPIALVVLFASSREPENKRWIAKEEQLVKSSRLSVAMLRRATLASVAA